MSEPTLYQKPKCIHRVPGIDAITENDTCMKCGAQRQWVVPVEPDYEAASKVLQSDESMTSWLMWATTIVDAALGIGDTDE